MGNRESAISSSALLLFISAPLASVCCALEASVERKSRGIVELTTRSAFSRIVFRVWPSILGAWLAQTVAVLILLFRAGHSYGSYLPVALAGMYMAIVLHALCGYVLGRYLPKILAVACAVIGSYGWVAFAWTVEPLQIRYMAGPALALCCTSAGELAPQAPWVLLLYFFIPQRRGFSCSCRANERKK